MKNRFKKVKNLRELKSLVEEAAAKGRLGDWFRYNVQRSPSSNVKKHKSVHVELIKSPENRQNLMFIGVERFVSKKKNWLVFFLIEPPVSKQSWKRSFKVTKKDPGWEEALAVFEAWWNEAKEFGMPLSDSIILRYF